ncbi:MAG TPA: DUF2214 family protein [Xanthobacteraceae bacterium]|nr:DUF2214 family protein [Xanthobacteraceae bacterium]
MTTLLAFLHHLSAFTLTAALAVEFVLVRGELTPWSARRILAADAVVGASAGLLLLVGLARVFFFEKGAAYYFANHAFLTKLTLFVAVALLSIVPTREFLSWRKGLARGQAPSVPEGRMQTVRTILHVELAALVVILFCAALMARGGWV